MRQSDAADGAFGKPFAVDQDTFRRATVFVDHETDQIAIILVLCVGARGEGGFAAVTPILQHHLFGRTGFQIMLHKTIEEEPARLRRGAIGIAVRKTQKALVHHPEFENPVVKPFFFRGPVRQIEAPAVQLRFEAMLIHIGHHMRIFACAFDGRRIRVFFEIAVEDDFITLFIGVDEMQDECGVGFEPANVFGLAIARDQRKAGRQSLRARRVTCTSRFNNSSSQNSGKSHRMDQFGVNIISCGRRGPGKGTGT